MKLEPRGEVDVHAPNATTAVVRLVDVQHQSPPLADPDVVTLTKALAGAIYTGVGDARLCEPPDDEQAQHQLIVATAAIAATELETLAALATIGLHRPMEIHARAVGLMARNAFVFNNDDNRDLAEQCYASLEVSRKHLAALALAILDEPELEAAMEQRYQEASGPSMQRLEQNNRASFTLGMHYVMNAQEQNAWSKWTHGDVIALADAADALRLGEADIRTSLNVNSLLALRILYRCGLFAITLLAVLSDRGFVAPGVVIDLVAQHQVLHSKMDAFAKFNAEAAQALRDEPS